jgi:N-acetylmuramoyl-L-alanine amidase
VTSPGDAARLATPEFRDALAEAVVAGIQRLYLPDHLDIPTGQFRLAALLT